MSEPQLVFDSAVEGLFTHGIPGRVTPDLKTKLKAVGLDLDRKLQPAYERETWRRILDVTVREAFPGVARDDAFRQLGRVITQGYDQTFLGRSVIAVTRLIGPRRMLDRLTRSLRSSNTYVAATVKELGPGDCQVHCTGLDMTPHFMAGIVEAGMGFCRARDFSVAVESSNGDEAVLRVKWTP